MSSLIVDIVRVEEIKPHPDPETTALELAVVKGWQCVVKKGSMKAGDLCVYFPLDSILPEDVSDAIGVTKYLSKGRVRAAKLRGAPSYGLLWPMPPFTEYVYETKSDHPFWMAHVFEEGEDVADLLGITKWEPPMEFSDADMETPHPAFLKYTEIENYRNFPNILEEGEEVVIREKVHGTNCRHALIDGIFMAGSHERRLKEGNSRYWHSMSEEIKSLLQAVSNRGPVIAYGEVFGHKVQDLHYGLERGNIAHRLFDISVQGIYQDEDVFVELCDKYSVPTMPVLYRGPWSFDVLEQFRDTDTKIEGGTNMMEGVVIKPVKERIHSETGRVILKYVWDRYLTRKGGTEKK